MNPRFGIFLSNLLQRRPGVSFPGMVIASLLADPRKTKNLVEAHSKETCGSAVRHVVGSCPWRGIFDVIIAGHVLRKHSDVIVGVL